jgi:electron transfer flavoprotein beta subunit
VRDSNAVLGSRPVRRGVTLVPLTDDERFSLMQRILVCLKRVVDYNVRVRLQPDGSGVVLDGVKMSINPFDEIALEEALRIRERGEVEEVVVASIGTSDSQQQLRTGLAMGADRAILVENDAALEPLTVARTLLALVERENPDLVLLGKQAIDADNNQTAQMLAALWQRPHAAFVSELSIDGTAATAVREVDAGLEVIEVDLPAVVSSDLRLNEPRYVKLPEIMKAKKKPLETVAFADLGIEATSQFSIISTDPPPERAQGIRVDNVEALVAELKSRGLVGG